MPRRRLTTGRRCCGVSQRVRMTFVPGATRDSASGSMIELPSRGATTTGVHPNSTQVLDIADVARTSTRPRAAESETGSSGDAARLGTARPPSDPTHAASHVPLALADRISIMSRSTLERLSVPARSVTATQVPPVRVNLPAAPVRGPCVAAPAPSSSPP